MLFISDYFPFATCAVSGCYFGLKMILEANRMGMRKFLFSFTLFWLADAGAVTAWKHLECEVWGN